VRSSKRRSICINPLLAAGIRGAADAFVTALIRIAEHLLGGRFI
jgi:hypothetical protein